MSAESAETWRAIRLGLALALANGSLTQREYDSAMTELTGTTDRSHW